MGIPLPPAAAQLAPKGPVPEQKFNPPMADTEPADAINRERWLQCVVSLNAAQGYFQVLATKGYFQEDPAP